MSAIGAHELGNVALNSLRLSAVYDKAVLFVYALLLFTHHINNVTDIFVGDDASYQQSANELYAGDLKSAHNIYRKPDGY